MPRISDHLVKSAIRLVRQSTTVPNTSNTSAFTAEISDMSTPCCFNFVIPGCAPLAQTRNLEIPGSLVSLAPRNDNYCSKHLAILHETGDIGDLIVENARLRIGGLRQPVHPACACRLRLLIHGLDQRPSDAETARLPRQTGPAGNSNCPASNSIGGRATARCR